MFLRKKCQNHQFNEPLQGKRDSSTIKEIHYKHKINTSTIFIIQKNLKKVKDFVNNSHVGNFI